MARRPFFTGDYGSALGRIDTRPIIEAGRAQGQMFAGLGAEAAKAIETYQLNKAEREKQENTAMGALAGMSQDQIEQLSASSPKLAKSIKNALSGDAKPDAFRTINAALTPFFAGQDRLLKNENTRLNNKLVGAQAEIGQITLGNEELRQGLELVYKNQQNDYQALLNSKQELDNEAKQYANDKLPEKLRLEMSLLDKQIAESQLRIQKQTQENSVFFELFESDMATARKNRDSLQSQINERNQRMARSRELSPLEIQKLEAEIAVLKADLAKENAELDRLRNLQGGTSGMSDAGDLNESEILGTFASINIQDAAQGDAAGIFGRMARFLPEQVGFDVTPEMRQNEAAIKSINMLIRSPFVRSITPRPSQYVLEQVDANLINPEEDTNASAYAKAKNLVTLLKNRVGEARGIVQADPGLESQLTIEANRQMNQLPILIKGFEDLVTRYEKDEGLPLTFGDTGSSTGIQIINSNSSDGEVNTENISELIINEYPR